ncbi:MAG TPA: hypothetical protein VFZ78_02090, partial [Flavisolibacter sp.]
RWLKAIRDDSLTWTHVSDLKYWDNAVARLYGIRGIPQNILVDPSGRIIAKISAVKRWKESFLKFLANNNGNTGQDRMASP